MLAHARNVVADNGARLPSLRGRRVARRVGKILLHGVMFSLLCHIGSALAARNSDNRAHLTRRHSALNGRLEPLRHTRRPATVTVSHDPASNSRFANSRRIRKTPLNQLSQELFCEKIEPQRDAATLRTGDMFGNNIAGDVKASFRNETAAARVADEEVLAHGVASWYSADRYNKLTASGSRFDENAMTAAHSWLPLGTRVRVTLEGTHESVVVTINDRLGMRSRVIDLSKGAARQLGILSRGVARVTLTRS